MVDGWNAWFLSDRRKVVNEWPGYKKNKMTIGELWLGFLSFYAGEFDDRRLVVCTRQSKAADMKGMGKEKNKQASVKKKTHKNRAGKVQETNRKRSDNGGGKKRYKALALAVKRHQEMGEERMNKQDLLFASVSKNLDQIDLLLGRMD